MGRFSEIKMDDGTASRTMHLRRREIQTSSCYRHSSSENILPESKGFLVKELVILRIDPRKMTKVDNNHRRKHPRK